MLTLRFETNLSKLNEVYKTLDIDSKIEGANFVFLDENKVVGLWRLIFNNDEAITDIISFKPEVSIEDKNFFVRAMLYKFQLGAPVMLCIKGKHEELKIFDFEYVDGDMKIMTNKINLLKYCKD